MGEMFEEGLNFWRFTVIRRSTLTWIFNVGHVTLCIWVWMESKVHITSTKVRKKGLKPIDTLHRFVQDIHRRFAKMQVNKADEGPRLVTILLAVVFAIYFAVNYYISNRKKKEN